MSIDNTNKSRLWDAIKHNIVVTLIGVIRTIVIKAVNYQEHVSEYGVHWNFFITIAVVTIAASLLPRSLHQFAHYIALAIMILYEILIKKLYLQEYIIGNIERVTFLDKNKEGIFQCFGYLSCYLCGMGLGETYKASAKKAASKYKFFFRSEERRVGKE